MKFSRVTLVAACLTFLFSSSSLAQKWVEMMHQPDANYYEIKKTFEKEWGNKTYVKGKGWKQYHRWAAFWESRVLEDGSFPMNSPIWKDFKVLLASQQKGGGIGNWSPMGPYNYNNTNSWSPGHGRINCVAVDPNNSNIIYAGAPVGGIWKTVDGGATWTPLGDEWSVIGVSGIAIDPSNSNIIYVATGDTDGNDSYSIGVLKSIDGGTTWADAGNVSANETTEIIIDPTNSNILYLASSSGLLKSTDAGTTWSNVLSGAIRDIDMKPGDNTTLYAVNSDEFFKSTDAGATWTTITNGLPNASGRLCIATTAANASYVYLLSADNSFDFQGLYRSTNSGNSFTAMNTTTDIFESTQAWYDMALAASQTNANEIVTGVINVWKSTNGGSSFTKMNSWSNPSDPAYTHADIHFLKYIGTDLFCGSDGGIYRSTNSANSFSDLTAGMQIGQFYTIAGSQNDPTAVSGGLQDNGGYIYDGSQWKVWYGADGMESGIDPNNSNRRFGMIQFGDLYVTNNGGNSGGGQGSPQSGRWVTPMQVDQNNPRLVAGYDDLYEFTWQNNQWNQLSTYNFGAQLRCIEIYDANSNIIFVSTDDDIWRTTNNGGSFTNISSNLPTNSYITSIEVNPADSDELWITRGGWNGSNHVYHTTNGGTSWTNITSNLPNLPCNIVKYDAGTNGGIYVGTDIGVYYYDNTLGSWLQYMNNLPNVIVNDLEINENMGLIRAGTYGRGVWESPSYTINDYDAGISMIISPENNYCNTTYFTPEVRLYNYGNVTMTSCTITYDVDGANAQTYNWTGSLVQGAFEDILLPAMTATGGPHTFNAVSSAPNGQPDQAPNNDANSKAFTITPNGNELILTLSTDCWGSETTWEILDSLGNNVLSGGPYGDVGGGETFIENICVANGCYDFNIYDTYGDGMFGSQWGSCTVDGSYSIDDQLGNNYVTMTTADFGTSATHNFCVQSSQITADFSSSTTEICEGGTVDFTDQSTSGTPTSWTWTFQGGTPASSSIQNPTGIQYNSAGTYEVELTVSDGIGTNTLTMTGYITVNAAPSVTTTAVDAACGQSDGSVTANPSGGESPYTYSWSPVAGSTATLNNLAPGNYMVTVTDANGCSSSASGNVSNVGGPTATISPNQTICEGDNATITAGGAGANGTYSWDQGLGNGASHSVSPTSTTTYSVVVTDQFGCSSTTSTTVTVNALPVVTTNPGNTAICDGESITLTANGADTYSWSSGGSGNSITVSPTSNTTYTVTGTTNGCSSDETVTIDVNANPTVAITPGSQTICEGESATLTASGAANYTWSSGGNGATETVTPSSTTTYTVTGTDNGCDGSAQATVTVQPLPSVTASADNYNVLVNGTVNFTASGSGSTFNWDFGDGNAGTGSSVSHQYSAGGVYTVVLTVTENGCSQTDTIQINVGVTSVSQNDDDEFVFVYPNPSDGNFVVELNNFDTDVEVNVFNAVGQLIYSQNALSNRHEVQLNSVSKGMYMLVIRSADSEHRARVIVK